MLWLMFIHFFATALCLRASSLMTSTIITRIMPAWGAFQMQRCEQGEVQGGHVGSNSFASTHMVRGVARWTVLKWRCSGWFRSRCLWSQMFMRGILPWTQTTLFLSPINTFLCFSARYFFVELDLVRCNLSASIYCARYRRSLYAHVQSDDCTLDDDVSFASSLGDANHLQERQSFWNYMRLLIFLMLIYASPDPGDDYTNKSKRVRDPANGRLMVVTSWSCVFMVVCELRKCMLHEKSWNSVLGKRYGNLRGDVAPHRTSRCTSIS